VEAEAHYNVRGVNSRGQVGTLDWVAKCPSGEEIWQDTFLCRQLITDAPGCYPESSIFTNTIAKLGII
jgi:hypothetical protein